jgi:hypothetical protein
MDTVVCRFILLQAKDTEDELMFAGRPAIEGILAGTEGATVAEGHAVLAAVAAEERKRPWDHTNGAPGNSKGSTRPFLPNASKGYIPRWKQRRGELKE